MTWTEPLKVRPNLDRWAWIVGLLLGLALAGWAFTGDLLLNFDQVIGLRIPFPRGILGDGAELPRRVPFYIPLAVLSRAIPGPALVAALLTASVTFATVGLYRLAGRDASALIVGAGYGLSPLLATRAAVGHLPLVVAIAMLPWALSSLERSGWRRAIHWGLAFGLLGSSGAVIGLIPAAIVALKAKSGLKNSIAQLGALALTQITWLVPGLLVLLNGAALPTTPSSAFATQIEGVGGVARLFAGGGFFIGAEDVAYRSPNFAALLGLTSLGLGLAGLIARAKFDLVAQCGVLGALLVLASADAFSVLGWHSLNEIGPLGLLRESQKFWPLVGVALGVGSAATLRYLASQRRLLFVLCAVGLAVLQAGSVRPGLFGAQGRLEAFPSPAGWIEITSALEDEGGTVAVFPWNRYDRLDISQGRNVLQPAPWLISGDVLISGDPGLGPESLERSDRFQTELADLDLLVRGGREIAPELRRLGIDWVLISGSPDAALYNRLGNEDSVETVVSTGNYRLFRVDAHTP